MHMVCAPLNTSRRNQLVEAAPMSQQQQLQRNPSPAVNAYLQHIQSKKGIDQRQTIASPAARGRVSSRQQQQQQQQQDPVGSSSLSRVSPKDDVSLTNRGNVAKTLPRSSPTNLTSTPRTRTKQRHGSKGRKSATTKPPLCSNQKHPRSIISEATNSTYLSSDSDEDASTATATVHSDGTSSFQSGPSTSGGSNRRNRTQRGSGTSPRNFPDRHHHHHAFNTDNALVPYQPNDDPYSSYTHDSAVDADDAYGTDNNSSNYYFTEQNQRHHRNRSVSYKHDGDHVKKYCYEDADAFSYSDEDDYYYHKQQQRGNHHQRGNNDHCDDQNYGENHDEDNDALAVDLDQLIEEASARWKLSVSETVQSTVTTATFGSQQMGTASATTTSFVSPVLQRQYNSAIPATRGMTAAPLFSGLVNEQYVPNNNNQNVSSFPDIVASTSSSSSQNLIHEQQSEIEALRAELQKHQQQISQPPPLPVTDPHPYQVYYPPPQQQQHQPVHPIQVLTVATDHTTTVEDDLTVWSGFHSMSAPPPIQQRPDADVSSVTGEHVSTRPSQLNAMSSANRATRVPPSQPPRPLPSTAQTIRLELSSIVTGITRSAVFTGTVTSKGLPTSDTFTTLTNCSITGSGVLQFIETGDVYRGDIVHSEMHGYGTYTFGETNKQQQQQIKVLRGRFEHNVFIGE